MYNTTFHYNENNLKAHHNYSFQTHKFELWMSALTVSAERENHVKGSYYILSKDNENNLFFFLFSFRKSHTDESCTIRPGQFSFSLFLDTSCISINIQIISTTTFWHQKSSESHVYTAILLHILLLFPRIKRVLKNI